MSDLDSLFEPLTIRGMTIPNRIVMAPMTRSFSPDGIPGEDVAAYYQRRGDADVGLLITEGQPSVEVGLLMMQKFLTFMPNVL